jgi:glutathione S-transferase
VNAKLYIISASHPAQAGRLMLEYKGITPKIVKMDLIAGMHDLRLKAAGFERGTVPALKIDGRHVQGTREIARALDEIAPEPPLFPSDPDARAAVEAAEAWGHDVLQPVPRVIGRAALVSSAPGRRSFVRSVGMPAFVAPATMPVLKRLAGMVGANPDVARTTVAAIPGHMDHVDQLLAEGVIGGPQRNAADFQIAVSVRFLLALEDLRPMVEGRPAEAFARAVMPDFAGPFPVGTIPAEWLPQAAAA